MRRPTIHGHVWIWPPAGVVVIVVLCAACGFKGGIYTRPGCPPGWVHCPSATACRGLIEIAGTSARPQEVY